MAKSCKDQIIQVCLPSQICLLEKLDFQAMRDVKNGLDSRFEAILKPLLACESSQSSDIIRNALELIFEHLHRDKALDLLNLLIHESTEISDKRRMRVLTQLVDFKNGVIVHDVQKNEFIF